MSCSDIYQVPKGTSSEYVCSDEQVWIQGLPPNCTGEQLSIPVLAQNYIYITMVSEN